MLFTSLLAIAVLSSCGGGNGGASSPPSPVLASIALTPASGTLELGSNQTFTATGTLTDNTTRDVTQTATWSSSDTTVLLLNNSAGRIGVANTRGPGMATVTAAVGSIMGTTQATVVRPTPRFLYASNVTTTSGAITAFRVDPTTGALTAIGTPDTTASTRSSLAVTRDSKFLYVAEGSPGVPDGYVSARAIQADGSLAQIPGSPFPFVDGVGGVVAHPTANFLFVSTQVGVTVAAYDPISGIPTTVSTVKVGDSSVAAAAPNGSRLYFYQAFYDYPTGGWQIAGFSVNSANEALSELPSGSIQTYPHDCFDPQVPNYYPKAVAVDPTGKFLYVAIASGDTICVSSSVDAYSIDPVSGAMTQIPGSPFTAGTVPVSVAAEASGRFLYVANNISSSVSAFAINPDTGTLTEIAGSPFGTASPPSFVVADPSGLFLYVGTASGILGFTIDQATGALQTNPGANAPGSAGNDVVYIAVTH
jgi:6-phosphogluconolactonase (cycloisomerase 2 family)